MAHRIARCCFLLATTLLIAPAAFAQADNPPPPPAAAPPPPAAVAPTEQPPPPPPPRRSMMQPPAQQPAGDEFAPPPGATGGQSSHRACAMDRQRFCADVQRGGGRIIGCLMAHRARLSSGCRAHLAAMAPGGGFGSMQPGGPPRSMMPPPADYGPPRGNGYAPPGASSGSPPHGRAALQASCGPELHMLCAGVARDGTIKCLRSHRGELSQPCQMFLREMRTERAAKKNVPNDNAPLPPPAAGSAEAPPPPPPPPAKNSQPPSPPPGNE